MFKNTRYSIKQAFIQMGRNRGMCITAIFSITAMLLILGLFFMLTVNVNVATDSIKDQFDNIEVFLFDSTDTNQALSLKNQLEGMKEVTSAEFISRDQALVEFKARFGNNAYLLDGLATNPLPNSLRVTLADLEEGEYVAEVCKNLEGVEDIRYYQSEVSKILDVSSAIEKGAIIIIAFLIIVSVVVVSNTVKLTVMARQEEIAIQKFVGATNWFIRGPLLAEGVLIGFISAALALGASAFAYIEFAKNLGPKLAVLASMQVVDPEFMIINLAWTFMALGISIGAFGSLISMRRFLNV